MELDDGTREALVTLAGMLEDEILPAVEAQREHLKSWIEELGEDENWEGTTDQERFEDVVAVVGSLRYLTDAVRHVERTIRALTDAEEVA